MCIIPLSIEIAKSSLLPKQVTNVGDDNLLSCSGNIALGINSLILFFSSLFFFSIKKTGILFLSFNLLYKMTTLINGHSFFF